MHQASGNSLTGFLLALITAVLWGMLPIALKVLLTELTANTITWVRFLAAAVFVCLVLFKQGNLPGFSKLRGKAGHIDADCSSRFVIKLHFISDGAQFTDFRDCPGGDPTGAISDDVRGYLYFPRTLVVVAKNRCRYPGRRPVAVL